MGRPDRFINYSVIAYLLTAGAGICLSRQSVAQPAGKPEHYVRPGENRSKSTSNPIDEMRVFTKPKWVTTKWDPNADAPFLRIEAEIKRFSTQPGPEKAKRAHTAVAAWKEDCQNAEKLFRAALTHAAANEYPNYVKELKTEVGMDLCFGFAIQRNPPKSYRFVRLAYRYGCGDRHFHDFGDLGKALLIKSPGDRGVVAAATSELSEEGFVGVARSTRKWMFTKEYEDFLLSHWELARKTSAFRPWDDLKIANLWISRAMRTRKGEDFDRALDYVNQAEKNTPRERGIDFESERKSVRRYKSQYSRAK